MSERSQIVAGGGWKGVRVVRIKVKAWLALVGAAACGALSTAAIGTIWFHAWIPAASCLVVSVALFVRERPRDVRWFRGRVGSERGKLYGVSGGIGLQSAAALHRISAPTRQTSSSKASSPQN